MKIFQEKKSKSLFALLSPTDEEDREGTRQNDNMDLEQVGKEVENAETEVEGTYNEEEEEVNAVRLSEEDSQGIEVEVIEKTQTRDKVVSHGPQAAEIRQSLPRGSKDKHKYLSNMSVQKQGDNPSVSNRKKKTSKNQ